MGNDFGKRVQGARKAILELLNRSDAPRLPSLRRLAAAHGFSVREMTGAATQLRDEGVVRFRKGAAVSAKPAPATHSQRKASADQFASNVRDQIARGELRRGQILDKIDTYAARQHLGRATVTTGLRRLEAQQLLHKQGKFWIVGPSPSSQPVPSRLQRSLDQRPVILVAVPDDGTWLNVAGGRYRDFFASFEEEARRYEVTVLLVYTKPDASHRVPPGAPWVGAERIRDLIRVLGGRFLGMVYIDRSDQPVEASEMLEIVARHNRPVVWYDKNERSAEPHPSHRLFTRCHPSEERMAALCVDTLVGAGHRRVVYASGSSAEGWQRARFEQIQHQASLKGLHIRLVERPGESAGGDSVTAPDVTGKWVRAILDQVVTDRESTAIIAPNDYSASRYFTYLSAERVDVPGRFSIVSFDNHQRVRLLPLSSIDAGHGHLGYCAFHLLFGILPVSRSPGGDIAATPFLADRGSIAQMP